MIEEILTKQRAFFHNGETLEVRRRHAVLAVLKNTILEMQDEILAALKEDLGKSDAEAYMCEVGLAINELSNVLKHMKCWARKRRKIAPLAQFPSRTFVMPEPYGNVLIMSPWNYPFLLTIGPLIYALAAGNTAVIKPSAYSPATSAVIKKLIDEIFTEDYVAVVEGGRDVNAGLLEQKWDYIFFTGSKGVGSLVMEKAAKHLTPVTLELGGKSPVIVDETANIKLAARRIAFGKYLNLGQTCVAPDHLFIQESVADKFLEYYKEEVKQMFGENALENEDYGKIINIKHYTRIKETLEEVRDKVILGGELQDDKLRISPTVLRMGALEDRNEDGTPEIENWRIMREEIFGPILPVITYKDLADVVDHVNSRPRPLATYIFSKDAYVQEGLLDLLHFGGGCINDTIIHLACDNMPFGGVGESGMGNYHGKYGFETFSHLKSVVDKANWLDLNMRYQPYSEFKSKLIKFFLK